MFQFLVDPRPILARIPVIAQHLDRVRGQVGTVLDDGAQGARFVDHVACQRPDPEARRRAGLRRNSRIIVPRVEAEDGLTFGGVAAR